MVFLLLSHWEKGVTASAKRRGSTQGFPLYWLEEFLKTDIHFCTFSFQNRIIFTCSILSLRFPLPVVKKKEYLWSNVSKTSDTNKCFIFLLHTEEAPGPSAIWCQVAETGDTVTHIKSAYLHAKKGFCLRSVTPIVITPQWCFYTHLLDKHTHTNVFPILCVVVPVQRNVWLIRPCSLFFALLLQKKRNLPLQLKGKQIAKKVSSLRCKSSTFAEESHHKHSSSKLTNTEMVMSSVHVFFDSTHSNLNAWSGVLSLPRGADIVLICLCERGPLRGTQAGRRLLNHLQKIFVP